MRKTIAVLISLCALLALAGCAGSTTGTLPVSPEQEPEQSQQQEFTPQPTEDEADTSKEPSETEEPPEETTPSYSDVAPVHRDNTAPEYAEYSQYRESVDADSIYIAYEGFFRAISSTDIETMKSRAARMPLNVADVTWEYLYNADGVIKEVKAPTCYLLDKEDNGNWTYFVTIPVVRMYMVNGTSQELTEEYAGYVTMSANNMYVSGKLQSTESTQLNDYTGGGPQDPDATTTEQTGEDSGSMFEPSGDEQQTTPPETVEPTTTPDTQGEYIPPEYIPPETLPTDGGTSDNNVDTDPPSWLFWD